jgi:DNA-binding protein YbaB
VESLPSPSAIRSYLDDLKVSLSKVGETQRKIAEVTGTAWSDDRMIKAVVGPRGQLLELEIDPRIYRRPNSTALAATIMATIRTAVEEATAKAAKLLAESMPKDSPFGDGPVGRLDYRRLMQTHDADLRKALEEADDVDLP